MNFVGQRNFFIICSRKLNTDYFYYLMLDSFTTRDQNEKTCNFSAVYIQ